MKITINQYVLAILIWSLLPTLLFAANGTLPGDGTEENPYLIEDFQDFTTLTNSLDYYNSNAYIIQQCNLDLDPCLPGRIVYDKALLGYPFFNGYYNGNGYSIKNMKIISDYQNVGLFGKLSGAIIENVTTINAIIDAPYANYVGGLCGKNQGSNITNCQVDTMITANKFAGGFVGENEGGTILNCQATGSVHANEYVGGFCGSNTPYFYGFPPPPQQKILPIIKNSYTTCHVNGNSTTGTFCGWLMGIITHCYFAGTIEYDYQNSPGSPYFPFYGDGAFVDEIVRRCFIDAEKLNMDYFDTYDPEARVLYLTTAQMQDINTYLNSSWDFNAETANGTDNIWHMPYNATGYPMLFYQRDIPGDLGGSYGVNMDDISLLSAQWTPDKFNTLLDIAQHWLAGQ